MQLTGQVTADSLMTLEAYTKWRKEHKGDLRATLIGPTVHLGDHITLQFESETTIRYQIQEMLLIEKIVELAGICAEIESYAPLVPDGTNWKATVMLEYPDVEQRKRELARLIGMEDRLYVQIPQQPRVYAIADEDLDREFAAYLQSLKWQLIQTKIFKDSDTKLVYEEVLAFTKGLIISNYAQYGLPAPEEKELESAARELLTKKEQANSIYDQLAEEKLTQYFKANASLKMKPLSYDDFVAEMKK